MSPVTAILAGLLPAASLPGTSQIRPIGGDR
jgi:hypothetical protein